MSTLFEIGLSNALAATALALVVWLVLVCVGARGRLRPQLVFFAWVLVLAKLLVPPLVPLPLASLRERVEPAANSVIQATINPPESLTVSLPEVAMIDGEPTTNIEEIVARLSIEREPTELEVLLPDDDSQRASKSSIGDDLYPDASAMVPVAELFDLAFLAEADAVATLDPVQIVLALWLTGSALWFILAAVRIANFRRLLRHARPAPAALEAEVRSLATRMNLRRLPIVRVVRRRVSPLVWGMTGQATILLPSALLNKLTDIERATLLAHELAHLKRRDHLVRLLELAALGLFWWHPVAWWARRNVERAAEHCCDAQVLELFPAQARSYAEALWTTVEFLSDTPSPLPLGASGFSQARDVKRRMEMILAHSSARRSGRIIRFLLPAIGLAILPVSLRSLWAEPPRQAVEVETAIKAAEVEEIEVEKAPAATPASEEVEVEVLQAAAQPTAQLEILQAEKPAEKAPTVEERLDRLEKMIQALAERPQAGATAESKKPPSPAKTPPNSDVKFQLITEAEASKIDEDVDHIMEEVRRAAHTNLELAKTNYHRYEAASRQLDAVERAFKTNTVGVDQVLEAQRRLVNAYLEYVGATAELSTDPAQRKLIVAKASLDAVNRELTRAHNIWRKVHEVATPGSAEAANEALAREQFFQFKSQTGVLLNEYQRALAAFKSQGAAGRGETSIEARKKLAVTQAAHKKAVDAVSAKAQDKLKTQTAAAEERLADFAQDRQKTQAALERARHEADAARLKSQALLRQAERMKNEAEVAAKKVEAAALQLEALKAFERASEPPAKPESP